MEPIIYILTYFCGYYIGSDFYNYYKSQQNYKNTIHTLDTITTTLSRIETRITELNFDAK
jgi:DNA-directed RNA polymerase subunit N (RpoN/RPB10)